jgi:hypothetical protein
MAAITLTLRWPNRKAIYRPRVDRPQFGIKKGTEVTVVSHGCFQVNDGDDDVNPYFIVELEDGRCTYVSPEDIQFVEPADEFNHDDDECD